MKVNNMFQQTQDQEYLDLCKKRLYSPENLIWTDQVSNIILQSEYKDATLNDIGCNVGHLYKTLASRGPNPNELTYLKYTGVDVEPLYLEIARERFPKGNFVLKDIENYPVDSAKITVCSATLEHLNRPITTLEFLLSKTQNVMILRTLVGETSQTHLRMKRKAEEPYTIHQFSFSELLSIMEYYGFHTDVRRDLATDSMPKYIDKGIIRTQYIIVGTRRIK